MVNIYLAMYSNEITWALTGLVGLALGAWLTYDYTRDKFQHIGFEDGYKIGLELGKHAKAKRDAKGRFTK
jgi:hypothetical protein